jgi:hypothetical protein
MERPHSGNISHLLSHDKVQISHNLLLHDLVTSAQPFNLQLHAVVIKVENNLSHILNDKVTPAQ